MSSRQDVIGRSHDPHHAIHHRHQHRRQPRWGLTLVEVVVVVGILGVLTSVALYGANVVRSGARQTVCENHLRSLGRGIHVYETSRGYLPTLDHEFREGLLGINNETSGFSFHAKILPHLDVPQSDVVFDPSMEPTAVANVEVARRLAQPLFKCPTDPASADLELATNYVSNWGPPRAYGSALGVITQQYGGAAIPRRLSIDDMPRGASNVAMLSEIGVFVDGSSYDAGRVFQLGSTTINPLHILQYLAECRTAVPLGNETSMGLQWQDGRLGVTAYTHGMPPNTRSCMAGDNPYDGLFTPSSHHRGGVNVVMADGSLRFVTDDIDPHVWRQMGSRVALQSEPQ